MVSPCDETYALTVPLGKLFLLVLHGGMVKKRQGWGDQLAMQLAREGRLTDQQAAQVLGIKHAPATQLHAGAVVFDGGPIRLVLIGSPRTKKNHGVMADMGRRCGVCKRGKFTRIFPSKQYREWEAAVLDQIPVSAKLKIAEPINLRAVFYRERATGDLVGYMQALADALQEAGVLADDRWVVQWDGTRLSKDAKRPRVEVEISAAVDKESLLWV